MKKIGNEKWPKTGYLPLLKVRVIIRRISADTGAQHTDVASALIINDTGINYSCLKCDMQLAYSIPVYPHKIQKVAFILQKYFKNYIAMAIFLIDPPGILLKTENFSISLKVFLNIFLELVTF